MAVGDKWRKLRGIIGGMIQLGIGGPNLKNNAGVVEVKNAADSAYANLYARDIQLNDGDTNRVAIKSAALSANWDWTLPPDDGSPSQVLQTDGAGVTIWATVAGGTDKPTVDTTSLAFGTGSPLTMFTLPANAVISFVKIIVDTAFNGTAPTVSIGVSGTVSKYMAATEVDLKTVGVYEVDPGLAAEGSTNAMIATYAADSSSAGAARILVEYAIPS